MQGGLYKGSVGRVHCATAFSMQSLHTNHMQMSIVQLFICRRLHMDTSMILICIWLICRLCTALHTKCCGAVVGVYKGSVQGVCVPTQCVQGVGIQGECVRTRGVCAGCACVQGECVGWVCTRGSVCNVGVYYKGSVCRVCASQRSVCRVCVYKGSVCRVCMCTR